MEDRKLQVTIKGTTRVSIPAGTAAFKGIAKKSAANESRMENLALDWMGPPTGPNQNKYKWMKKKKEREKVRVKSSKVQLGKCILAT